MIGTPAPRGLRWVRATIGAPTALRRALFRNIGSLYVVQGVDYLLPLVTIPYLIRVLGPERYGSFTFGLGLVAYLDLVVGYGFNYSASRRISIYRDEPATVSRVAGATLLAKSILCLGGLGVLALLTETVPRLAEEKALLYLLYGVILGNTLFPFWLYQGLERFVAVASINLAARLGWAMGIFLLVHEPEDYLVVAALEGGRFVAVGVAGLMVARFRLRVTITAPSVSDVRGAFADGWMVFLSVASVGAYTVANPFILGMLAGSKAVGYYSAAAAVAKAVLAVLGPVSQAMYPVISQLGSRSQAQARRLARRLTFGAGILGLSASFGLLVGGPVLVTLVFGAGYEASAEVLRILTLLPCLIALSHVFGIQLMLPFGRDRAFAAILGSAALVNVVLALTLVPRWQQIGMAIAVVASEGFVTGTMFAYLTARGLNPLADRHDTRVHG